MRTMVYVDALNLYYRAVRQTPYRWLDPVALSDRLLPSDQVLEVKYFTAKIKGLPHDPGAPTRQDIYWRALRTVPGLSIENAGFFVRRKTFAALSIGQVGQPFTRGERWIALKTRLALIGTGLLQMQDDPIPRIRIWKTEEKGSDVNLATQLLVDGFSGAYEKAAVISNDSDLEAPVGYVRHNLGLPVTILDPSANRNQRLAPLSLPKDAFRAITLADVAACQLPAQITDAKGTFHAPADWNGPKKR